MAGRERGPSGGILPFVVLLCAALLLPAAAQAGIDAALGDTVPLSGYSSVGTTVYLFLTGPNLPADGVSLDDLTTPAAAGGLTRVSVDEHDHWEYEWDTTAGGRALDAGTYTVWVTDEPVGRSGLRHGTYQAISVTLRVPGFGVAAPTGPGSVAIQSAPADASVTFDGEYRGKTPLTLADVNPGTHMVTLSRFGYNAFTVQVPVEAGAISDVSATLVPATGAIAITADPAGARVLLDGQPAGQAPLTLTGIAAGSHTVTAEREGYQPQTATVVVETDRTAPVSITLVKAGLVPGIPIRANGGPVAALALIVIVSLAGVRHRSRERPGLRP